MDMSFLKQIPGAFPKGVKVGDKVVPAQKARDDLKASRKKRDEDESKKVRKRSTGQCEVLVKGKRCKRRALEVHHHEGGNGRRGRGSSALAKNKTHMCTEHHRLFNGKRLLHVRGNTYREVA